jgi:hypothetical protein
VYLFIYSGNIDIPEEFTNFIGAFKKKIVHFLDRDRRYYTMSLRSILQSGLTAIEAFKKEMGHGEKVVKLKGGTKQNLKREMCNWAYFYICLSDISSKISIVVVMAHLLLLVFLYSLQTPFVLLDLLPSQLSHQFPGNFNLFVLRVVLITLLIVKRISIFLSFELFFHLLLVFQLLSDHLPLLPSLVYPLKVYIFLMVDKVSKMNPYVIVIRMLHNFGIRFFVYSLPSGIFLQPIVLLCI